MYTRWSNYGRILLFILPVLLAVALTFGLIYGKNDLLHFYLFRLGLLPSAQSTLSISMPQVIPRSGPTEKLLGRFLLLFNWNLDGVIVHPTLGALPFHFALNGNNGNFFITTEKGGVQGHWDGKKRWIKFDQAPLALLPTLPDGQIDGEWADVEGHTGDVSVYLKGGETISFRGQGENVLITTTEFKLEGNLNFELPTGKSPALTLSHGFGTIGKHWGLKEVQFDSANGRIEGLLTLTDPFIPVSGVTLRDGFGRFQFDILEKKLIGTNFEATVNFLNEDKKALFPYWETDRDGGAFEAWIEKEGLIKGIYGPEKIHLFEGSFLGGIELGPLVLSQEKLEGAIKGDLASFLTTWSRWSLFPLPPLPPLEGKFDGEVYITPKSGNCRLDGSNLKFGDWPLSSANFDIQLEPDRLSVKEGSIEECIFSFDLVRKDEKWEMPAFALLWRDFLKGFATGQQTETGIALNLNHLSIDLALLETIAPVQELLHRFDLTGFVKGSGKMLYNDQRWSAVFNLRGKDWMSGKKAFPLLEEITVEVSDQIRLSGGSFLFDQQHLTLESGTIDANGLSCMGKGNFLIPWITHRTLSGPWQYTDGYFSGIVDVQPYGPIHWKKEIASPLTLWNPLYDISCEVEEEGMVRGKWKEALTFEMTLEGEGKGEGKANLLGLPLPEVPIQSPLPLELAWIYPSIGTLPFKLSEGGLLILPGGELYSAGKGIRYEKVEGLIGWDGHLSIRLLPKAARLPLYWLERGEIAILGSIEEPKVVVKWR